MSNPMIPHSSRSEEKGRPCPREDDLALVAAGLCDSATEEFVLMHTKQCGRCEKRLGVFIELERRVLAIRRGAGKGRSVPIDVPRWPERPAGRNRKKRSGVPVLLEIFHMGPGLTAGLAAHSDDYRAEGTDFGRVLEKWRSPKPGSAAPRDREDFMLALTASEGEWIQACRALAWGGGRAVPDGEEVEALFEEHWESLPKDQDVKWSKEHKERASTMLSCARILSRKGLRIETLEDIERTLTLVEPEATGGRRRLIAEMLCLLSGQRGEGVERLLQVRKSGSVQLPVVMVTGDWSGLARGVSATLQLDLMEEGSGVAYPAAENCLVPVDESFLKSLVNVREFLRQAGLWDETCDIRWTIRSQQPVTLLRGGSLGSAFALGIGELVARQLPSGARPVLASSILRVTSIGKACLSGPIEGEEGKLTVVNGVKEKVDAALGDPTITILVMPESARKEVANRFATFESVQRPGTFFLPRQQGVQGLTVLCIRTLFDALDLIPLEWHMPEEINWRLKEASVDKLVPRPWLKERVDRFIGGSGDSGLFLIVGEAGTGKSGFIARCTSEELDRGGRPVVHFITRDFPRWDDPAEIYGSLCAQLRRKYGNVLAPRPGEEFARPDGSALGAARRLVADLLRLSKQGVQETIWVDGLDEAYGERARFESEGGALHEILEVLGESCLPRGIRLVATSRPGARFDHLRRLRECSLKRDRYVNLDDTGWGGYVEEDLHRFFRSAMPGMDARGRDRVINVVKRDRPFLHAVLWARSSPAHVGGGGELTLNELLDRDLKRISDDWRRARRDLSEEQASKEVLDVLGLLACARQPLTLGVVDALFERLRAGQIDMIADHAVRCALLAEREFGESEDRRLRFFHDCIAEFIVRDDPESRRGSFLHATKQLLARQKGESDVSVGWHRELACRCLRWRELESASLARAYALRFLLSHLRHARMWEELEEAILDVELIRAKLNEDSGGIFDFVRLLEKALGGFPRFPMDYPGRPLLNDILEVLKAHEDAISSPVTGTSGGSGWLALQQLYNEVANPYTAEGEGVKEGSARFGRWRDDMARALERGEAEGKPWLSLERVPLDRGVRPEKMRRHVNQVCAAAFSHRYGDPDGEVASCLLATAGADREIHLWKVDNGHVYLTSIPLWPDRLSPAHRKGKTLTRYPLSGIAFLKCGDKLTWLVSASAEGIRVFRIDLDAPREPEEIAFFGMNSLPQSLAAPTEGGMPFVVVGCQDGRAVIWNALRQRVVAELGRSSAGAEEPASMDPYCCVAMSAKGDRVAVGCPEDRHVRVWELAGNPSEPDENGRVPWRLIREFPPTADRRVDSLAFSPDGRLLAVGGGFRRGQVELWNLETGACVSFPAHKDSVWSLTFARDPSDPDALVLISGSYDRSVAVWDLKAIETLASHSGVAPRMLRGHRQGDFPLQELKKLPKPLAHLGLSDVVFTTAVSPGGSHLAVGGADCAVSLWDFEKLLERRRESLILLQPEAATLHAAVIHPQGNRFATASAYGEVQIFCESGEGREIAFNASGDRPMRTVRFSADGQLLAYGGDLGAGVYDLRSGMRFGNLAPGRAIYAVAFSGSRLALGDREGRTVLIEHFSEDSGRDWRVHEGCVRALAFSPDGHWLASVGDDRKLILTDLSGGGVPREIGGAQGHQGRVKSVAISPLGDLIATGGFETVRLWKKSADGSEWALRTMLRAHRDEIWTLAFSPDGRLLASGSHDGTARVWHVEKGIQIGCLPCWNNVLAVWLSADSSELRVVEGGQTGSVPAFHIARLRGLAPK